MIKSRGCISVGETGRRGGTGGGRNQPQPAVRPNGGTQAGRFLNGVVTRRHTVPSEAGQGSARGKALGGDVEKAAEAVWIRAREIVLPDGHAFAGRVGVGIHIGGAKILQQPGDGQTVGR